MARSGLRSALTPLATMRRASMSRPESVSSRMASLGSSTAIWKISLRFFSPPEKPVFHRVVAHVFAAGLGLDGEPRRHGKPRVGHLRQPGAFAAQLVLHLAVAVGLAAAEEIHIFRT